MKTFKEMNGETPIEKIVKKAGLSLCLIFSKEDIKRFNIKYNDKIRLDDAVIVKDEETQNT